MAEPERVSVARLPITLGQLLKWLGAAATGGQVKHLLAAGGVRVNGAPETRRGRKLHAGDRVELPGGRVLELAAAAPGDTPRGASRA